MAKATRESITKSPLDERAAVAAIDAKHLRVLEPFVCDVDLMLDVLSALVDDMLTSAGDITLSERETERIYFATCLAREFSAKLKKAYYNYPDGVEVAA